MPLLANMRSEDCQDNPPKRPKRKAPTGEGNQPDKLPKPAAEDLTEGRSANTGTTLADADDRFTRPVGEDEAQGVVNNPRRITEVTVCGQPSEVEPMKTGVVVSAECRNIEKSLETLSNLRLREARTCSDVKQLHGVSCKLNLEEQDLIARLKQINEQRTNLNVKLNHAEMALCSIRTSREENERAVNVHCSRIMEFHEEEVKLLKLAVEGHIEKVKLVEGQKTKIQTICDERSKKYVAASVRLKAETDRQASEKARFTRELDIAAQTLKKEVDKHICQTCRVRSRSALVMPCMHFLFCGECFYANQKKSNECPTCKGAISALIHCRLNVD